MLKRVLVLEDDYFLAMDAADSLSAAGAEVVGPVARVEDALDLLEREGPIDLAILDVQLIDGKSYAVAAEARRRGIPVVFVTAYDPDAIAAEHKDVPVFSKPWHKFEVGEVLRLAA